MPIIINEIEISVEVTPDNNSGQGSGSTQNMAVIKDEIIKECVEKIMEIINQKNER